MTTSRAQIRVTIEDLATGDKESVEVKDDYLIVCAGSCFESSIQTHSNGTHVITVKRPAAAVAAAMGEA